MKCPVCQVPTYAVEHLGIELDVCPECQGVWFDRGELDLLLEGESAGPLTVTDTVEKVRSCPLCAKPMAKASIGPTERVLIDSCREGCGLWFDRGELNDLTRDLAAEGWSLQHRIRAFLTEVFAQKGE